MLIISLLIVWFNEIVEFLYIWVREIKFSEIWERSEVMCSYFCNGVPCC
jgi:hypothetical protein